ncbi:signal protein [Occallatibacter savannae]|uniref:signal protein n=1 Tax=Occallatibacter savannae TaxID=1002691 RepID=UPI000D6923FE|nr:signal protein [Occallatibacter savannae]
MKMLRFLVLGFVASGLLSVAQSTAPPSPASQTKSAKAKVQADHPSASDIADAKAKGLVWVNLNTKVYHKADATQYGTTKNGKFMSEADAKTAGYREAKDAPTKGAKKSAEKK